MLISCSCSCPSFTYRSKTVTFPKCLRCCRTHSMFFTLANLPANFTSYTPFDAISKLSMKLMQLCRSIHDEYKKQRPNREREEVWKRVCQLKNKEEMHIDNDNDDLSNIDVSLENCALERGSSNVSSSQWLIPPDSPSPLVQTVAASATSSTGWQHMTLLPTIHNPIQLSHPQTPSSFRSHTSFVLLASTFLYLFQVVGFFSVLYYFFCFAFVALLLPQAEAQRQAQTRSSICSGTSFAVLKWIHFHLFAHCTKKA